MAGKSQKLVNLTKIEVYLNFVTILKIADCDP